MFSISQNTVIFSKVSVKMTFPVAIPTSCSEVIYPIGIEYLFAVDNMRAPRVE
ncbi:MAG: hypothetical protein R2788_22545 [Saprospiraceae bacterium]